MGFYEKENMLFLQRYMKDNPISLEEILQATEESYKEGVISTKEYQKVIHGQTFENKSIQCNDFLILIYNDKISAAALAVDGKIKVKKVFL